MIYIKWFLLFISNLLIKYLIAWPLTPVIVLFTQKNGWLPNWLYWFQTHDNSLDGDFGWISETRPFLNESNKFKRYINRCFWIWRNSLYGFNESVLSLKTGIGNEKLITQGNPLVGNGPSGVEGLVKRYFYRNGELIAFQWYYIRRLKSFQRKCIRINIGWKLWGEIDNRNCHIAGSCWINKFTT